MNTTSFYNYIQKTTLPLSNYARQVISEHKKQIGTGIFCAWLLYAMYQEYKSRPAKKILAAFRKDFMEPSLQMIPGTYFYCPKPDITALTLLENLNKIKLENPHIVTEWLDNSFFQLEKTLFGKQDKETYTTFFLVKYPLKCLELCLSQIFLDRFVRVGINNFKLLKRIGDDEDVDHEVCQFLKGDKKIVQEIDFKELFDLAIKNYKEILSAVQNMNEEEYVKYIAEIVEVQLQNFLIEPSNYLIVQVPNQEKVNKALQEFTIDKTNLKSSLEKLKEHMRNEQVKKLYKLDKYFLSTVDMAVDALKNKDKRYALSADGLILLMIAYHEWQKQLFEIDRYIIGTIQIAVANISLILFLHSKYH
jgi:hypothetical protein